MNTFREPDDPRATRIELRRQLIGCGWTDYALRAMVLNGQLAKPRTGAYVSGPAWRRLDPAGQHEVRARTVVRQARTPMVVSHTSGLPFHDAPDWGVDFSAVHVTRRDGRAGRAEAGVRQHQGLILRGDVVRRGDVAVMHPTRVALECTTVLSVEAALVQVNDLLHRGLTDLHELRGRYAKSMEHWPHSLTTDLVLQLADPRPESVGESRTLHLFWKQGLPRPIPQYVIRDQHGRELFRVDFAWPDLGVFGEFDGKVKYTRLLKDGETAADVVLREKKREEQICRLTGWRCIRFTWAELERPEQTALEVRRTLFRGTAA